MTKSSLYYCFAVLSFTHRIILRIAVTCSYYCDISFVIMKCVRFCFIFLMRNRKRVDMYGVYRIMLSKCVKKRFLSENLYPLCSVYQINATLANIKACQIVVKFRWSFRWSTTPPPPTLTEATRTHTHTPVFYFFRHALNCF